MKHLYGEFSQEQVTGFVKSIQGSIFFLLLCGDPQTKDEYKNVDVNKNFRGLQLKLAGANELFKQQSEIISVMALLEAAKLEYNKDDFEFSTYRKLILDAGAEISRMKVGD